MTVLQADVFSSNCPSRTVLQHLTGRWGALTLAALDQAEGPLRFAEIRRRIAGISDRMLSQTLTQLERDGIVVRTVHSEIPPHVEYSLTQLGEELAEPLLDVIDILEAKFERVLEAQERYDVTVDPH